MGSQLSSGTFITAGTASGAKLSVERKGVWIDNKAREVFWRSLKVDALYLKACDSVAEAKHWIRTTIDRVNAIRWHASLADQTSNEFHKSTQAEGRLIAP